MVKRQKTPVVFRRKLRTDSQDEIIRKMSALSVGQNSVCSRFEDMGLDQNLLKGIYGYGLERPAFIQERAIVPCIRGNDSIIQAQSGMGKTAAVVIAILQRIRITVNPVILQTIVLAPTRELAEQIVTVFQKIGCYHKIKCIACVGGTKVKHDKERLVAGVDIVVGTLGRLNHLVKEEAINLNSIQVFVMDEADRMIGDTKRNKLQLSNFIGEINGNAQFIMMSATMPQETYETLKKFMPKSVDFLVSKEHLTLEGISQYFLEVDNDTGKIETITDLFPSLSNRLTMVFCKTRAAVDMLKARLAAKGLVVSFTHSALSQPVRESTLKEFSCGVSRVIVTSDLLGRGIDIQGVSVVINYDLPANKEEYIHRVGRGGRHGRKGVAITFVTPTEMETLSKISLYYQTEIKQLPANLQNIMP